MTFLYREPVHALLSIDAGGEDMGGAVLMKKLVMDFLWLNHWVNLASLPSHGELWALQNIPGFTYYLTYFFGSLSNVNLSSSLVAHALYCAKHHYLILPDVHIEISVHAKSLPCF